MKLRLMLFLVMVMVPCGQVAAQELLDVDVYDGETIYIHPSILGNGFVKDGHILDLGRFGSNLAKEVAGSGYALEEMRKARTHKIAGTVTTLVATVFQVTALVMAFRDDVDDGQTLEITSLALGGLFGMVAQGFNQSAMAAMNRAVWLYNRDIAAGVMR